MRYIANSPFFAHGPTLVHFLQNYYACSEGRKNKTKQQSCLVLVLMSSSQNRMLRFPISLIILEVARLVSWSPTDPSDSLITRRKRTKSSGMVRVDVGVALLILERLFRSSSAPDGATAILAFFLFRSKIRQLACFRFATPPHLLCSTCNTFFLLRLATHPCGCCCLGCRQWSDVWEPRHL
jgi:hypothetical protein